MIMGFREGGGFPHWHRPNLGQCGDLRHAFRVRFVNRDWNWRQDERIVYDDGFDGRLERRQGEPRIDRSADRIPGTLQIRESRLMKSASSLAMRPTCYGLVGLARAFLDGLLAISPSPAQSHMSKFLSFIDTSWQPVDGIDRSRGRVDASGEFRHEFPA